MLVFFVIVTNLIQFQGKFDYCKEQNFKPKQYCELPKKLEKLGGK